MKKIFFLCLMVGIVIDLQGGRAGDAITPIWREKKIICQEPVRESFILEALTVYNPVKAQCKDNPWTTASGKWIPKKKLKRGHLRWMALSRDLLSRWGGKISYGDTVIVSAGDPVIDGDWVVEDTMNRRYCSRGDLLFDVKARTLGKWENVIITIK